MDDTSALHDRRYRPVDAGSALLDATAALRTAFADVGFDADMPRCSHCVDEQDVAALGAEGLELSARVLSRFVVKAGTTWGRPADLRRVAPAVLALMADQRLAVDRSLVWSRLRWAGWPDWPDHQVTAVHAFLQAELLRLVCSPVRPAHVAHRWLAATAAGVADLRPFLATWHDALGPLTGRPQHAAAVDHLVALLTDSRLDPDRPATVADVFPGHPRSAAAVADWLAGPATKEELDRAASVLARTPKANRIAAAAQHLQRFSDARAGAPGQGMRGTDDTHPGAMQ